MQDAHLDDLTPFTHLDDLTPFTPPSLCRY